MKSNQMWSLTLNIALCLNAPVCLFENNKYPSKSLFHTHTHTHTHTYIHTHTHTHTHTHAQGTIAITAGTQMQIQPDTKNYQNRFKVVDGMNGTPYEISAPDPQTLQQWKDAIQLVCDVASYSVCPGFIQYISRVHTVYVQGSYSIYPGFIQFMFIQDFFTWGGGFNAKQPT